MTLKDPFKMIRRVEDCSIGLILGEHKRRTTSLSVTAVTVIELIAIYYSILFASQFLATCHADGCLLEVDKAARHS